MSDTDPRLVLLRVQLFTAMQQLEGEDLVQFWQLIDDVTACRKPQPWDLEKSVGTLPRQGRGSLKGQLIEYKDYPLRTRLAIRLGLPWKMPGKR